VRSSLHAREDVIDAAESADPFDKVLAELHERREKIRQDAQALAALDPASPEHRALRTQVERETAAADDLENTTARAREALATYRATSRGTTRGFGRTQGAGLAAAGLVVTVATLGGTVMIAGIVMVAVGALLFVLA
jgi:ferric-dicitrate binding protein FerR (iron transport regulator)